MLITFLFEVTNSVLLNLFRLLLVSVHSLTMPLQFLLFLSVCCEVSFDIQFRQRFPFRFFSFLVQSNTSPGVQSLLSCRQYIHKHCTYSSVQPVHKRGTHITRLAQGREEDGVHYDKKFLHNLLSPNLQANEERQGNLLQVYEERFEKLSEDQKLSRLCSEVGLRSVEVGQFFFSLPSPRGEANQSLCREITLPRFQKGTQIKGWIQNNVRFGPVSDKHFAINTEDTVLKSKFNLCSKIKPNLGLEL